jgi:hypothetical protein
VAREPFPLAWLREQCFGLCQRGVAALQRMCEAAAPTGSRGLRVIQDTSKQTFERLRTMPWRSIAWRYKVPLWVFGGILVAAVLLVIIIEVPQQQAASWRGQPGVELKDLPKLENDARTTLIQGLGGAVLLIGLYLTFRNLQLTQDKQITEHYTRAVEQLGSDKLEVRLGAIYTLERIARGSERDHSPIMEILTTYIREHAPNREGESLPLALPPALDITTILTVLERRNRTYEQKGHMLNLGWTNLFGVTLLGAHLERVSFHGACMEKALLLGTHFERANFVGACLREADLSSAHLEGAQFVAAKLEKVRLVNAHLEGAHLRGARLEGANLRGAFLERATGLMPEQLASVKTLYQAHLDPPLLEQIQQQCPHLLEKPQD